MPPSLLLQVEAADYKLKPPPLLPIPSLLQDEAAESKLKTCSTPDLLERMPLAHKLLSRLIACIPQGSATGNEIVVQACGLVSAFWGGLGVTVQACDRQRDRGAGMRPGECLLGGSGHYGAGMRLADPPPPFRCCVRCVPCTSWSARGS